MIDVKRADGPKLARQRRPLGGRQLRKQFPVVNPRASLAEVERYVRGEQQAVPCIGGYKYFYLDWNLDIRRCEAWTEPLGSVLDLDRIPRPARTLQRLHDGLLPQRQHADACRRRSHRCGAGNGRRPDRNCRGISFSTQRSGLALGADRGDAEVAPPGAPAEASRGFFCSPFSRRRRGLKSRGILRDRCAAWSRHQDRFDGQSFTIEPTRVVTERILG